MDGRNYCEVCEGEGQYPIHARGGKHIYDIACPECDGSGFTDESAEDAKPTLGDLCLQDTNQPVK